MKSFRLETKPEREERIKNSFWNIENFKYKNITKELAEGYIKVYWIGGIFILVVSSLFYLLHGQITSYLFDFILATILIFGIYKKVRWAGLIYFIYFLIGKINILLIDKGENIGSILWGIIIFSPVFYLGTISLFRWHKLNKNTNETAPHIT